MNTFTILDSIFPLTFVVTSIGPEHFAIAVSEIAFVISLEDVAIGPCEDAITPFFVVLVLTLVLV
jgi:hypothetical protein